MRAVAVPQDTELAIMFKPSLPGKEPKGPATPGAPIKYTKAPLTLKRPANLEDVAFWPIHQLAALIERRLVTSTELTQMYLGRLKKLQPTLNFYVTLTEELALKQAAQADSEIKAGKYRGPLHGLPWGAKDLFATKGIKTTWGGEPYVDQVIDYDATIVERLREAGAVLVAKLTLGALAQGDRWFGGQTKKPMAAERPEPRRQRLVGRSGLGDRGRLRRVRDRHRDARLDHFALDRQRHRRSAADRMAASAATARWRSRTRWTRSGRCAGTSKTRSSS
jgi:hypothetical protein